MFGKFKKKKEKHPASVDQKVCGDGNIQVGGGSSRQTITGDNNIQAERNYFGTTVVSGSHNKAAGGRYTDNSISMSNGQAFVNGKKYTIKGNSCSVQNGKVFVDGKEIGPDDGSKSPESITNVVLEGDVEHLESDCPVVVNGNVGSIVAKGSVS